MVDMDNRFKLLMSAFIVILLGVVLISPIADDIELAKTSSRTVLNESFTFVIDTSDISNESNIVTGNATLGFTIKLTHDNLTAFTELRNQTADIVGGLCNATLSTGTLTCNGTNSTNLFSDYTYISRLTATFANDELLTLDAIRNDSVGN